MTEVPEGLRAAGLRFWEAVTGQYDLDLDETEVLTEACRTLDELDVIAAALRESTPLTEGPRGAQVANPLYAEARAHRGVLNRLLKTLGLGEDEQPESWTTKQAREAAQARWRQQKDYDRRNRGA